MMKRLIWLGLLLAFAGFAQKETSEEEEELAKFRKSFVKHEQYKEVTFRMLKAAKDDYKNKKIYYEGPYLGFQDTFPVYFEKSGFRASKYYCLAVVATSIPVMVKKKAEWKELVSQLKNGAKVRVYGRLKKFKRRPKATWLPNYYLELHYLQVLNPRPKPVSDEERAKRARFKRWRQRF